MPLGLFDVVGPVMHGPSSNHTAGATRIGYLAREIMGGTPSVVRLGFHKAYIRSFAGQNTHSAMIAGLLGYREYDDAGVGAMSELKARGIPWSPYAIEEENITRNNFRVLADLEGGEVWEVNGDSIGAGNIIIDKINGLSVFLDGNNWELIVTSDDESLVGDVAAELKKLAGSALKHAVSGQNLGDKWLFIGTFGSMPPSVGELGEALSRKIPGGELSPEPYKKIPDWRMKKINLCVIKN